MAPDTKVNVNKLMKNYRIQFDNQGHPDSWPDSYQETFASIKDLGKREFKAYSETIDVESHERPWRAQTKTRAKRISDLADRCRKSGKNEPGWRMSLESEILFRFTVEVNCRKCRARLWRSEIEADIFSSSPGPLEQDLHNRRARRTPCMCGPSKKPQDPLEQGLNPLFDDRADEFIHYEEKLRTALGRGQKPDRIYGLRANKKLDRLLSGTRDKHDLFIEDSISSSPFASKSEPLLFPFLILEAKSEKSSNSFSDIEAQSAFAIRALLILQDELKGATEQSCQWDTEPTVWFFSNKGEDWRIAAAYVGQDTEGKFYRIVDLWHGKINIEDDALQLLLIVDYIFDWARDVYRETIIKQLWSLAAHDTPSLAGDSDIFSRLGDIDPWVDNLISSIDTEPTTQQIALSNVPEALRKLDCKKGVIRDARYFQACLYALRVSEDSLDAFFQSETTAAKSQKLARDLQRFLEDAVRVNEATLDQLETLWTGQDLHGTMSSEPSRVYMVKVCMTAYLTPRWEQVVELTYVAVEEAAVDALKKHADMIRGWRLNPESLPLVGEKEFLRVPRKLRHSSSQRDILLAAIAQRCLEMHSTFVHDTTKENISRHDGSTGRVSISAARPALTISRDDAAKARHIVLSIYNRYRVGMRQPSENFLRHSFCNGELARGDSTSSWQRYARKGNFKMQIAEDENLVYIRNSDWPEDICLYLIDGPPDYNKPPSHLFFKMNLHTHYIASPQRLIRQRSYICNKVKVKTRKNDAEEYFDAFVHDFEAKCNRLADVTEESITAAESSQALPVAINDERLDEQTRAASEESFPSIPDPSFSFCLLHELHRLNDMMITARVTGQLKPSTVPNEHLEGQGESRNEDNPSPEQTSGSDSPRSNEESGSRKRPFDLTEEETSFLTAENPVKRLSNRPSDIEFESDRLDDHEVEALLRDGCFGYHNGPERMRPFGNQLEECGGEIVDIA